jgi:TldD protein
VPLSETYAHTGGMELFENQSPQSIGKNLSEKAIKLLEATECPFGTFNVIIQPALCATLLHEAIGHPLEADLAMAGGGFSNHIENIVSSELVTIYDSGLVGKGLGYFTYDDEGVKCNKTTLIEKGVLKSYMHDRTSASLAGIEPTGNAHAWDFNCEPLIRQTNIGLEAGDFTIDEMIEGIKDGLILDGTFGGQANTNADFTFGFQLARAIKNGESDDNYILGANVSGNAIEVFKTINAISNKAILRPGACGKWQFAIQGRIVPAIRCNIMVGGKGG